MSKIVEKYEELKQVDSSKLYLFKSGKFYIFIGDDCDYINEYIVLKKTKFSGEYCKCGFPVDSIDNYLRVFNNHNLNIEIITDFHVDNSKKESDIVDMLKKINPDKMTPLEALNFLYKLKEIVNEKK